MKPFYIVDIEFDTAIKHVHRRYAVSSKRTVVEIHTRLESERNLKLTWYNDGIRTADEVIKEIEQETKVGRSNDS